MSVQKVAGCESNSALRAPATMDDEGLADAAAANPFRFPSGEQHEGIDAWSFGFCGTRRQAMEDCRHSIDGLPRTSSPLAAVAAAVAV
jgi:hypothetical protein